ncbi:MAG: dihydrofolate reductase family protein [Pseudomonadales bacterium]
MKCSVYIATSADGYIAEEDGSVGWLDTAGNPDADMSENPDMGFGEFLGSVDCLVMGRKCMDMISSMNLTPEQWPYGDAHVVVLSSTVKVAPKNLLGKVELHSGKIADLVKELDQRGFKHAYIDGGTTITAFINENLINEITITKVPVLLGAGIPLFGNISQNVKLTHARATAFPNDFIQVKYNVNYL